jgi:hypothetical protein
MRELELRLQAENPRYRRIWVQYSNHRQLNVVLTLFPQGNGEYRMVFGNPRDLSYESINAILQTDKVESAQ